MPTYVVWIYCPFCLQEFSITVDAPTSEMAKKKAVGRQVTCPADPRHIFEVEEDFIVNAYPLKTVPRPAYKVMSEEEVKRARWLRAAIPPEEPLPIGARPVGWPKFVGEPIPDALTTFLFEQKVECLSSDTEILTEEGWKTFDKIKEGDRVLTFNIKKEKFEYQPIKKVFVKRYVGPMYRIRSRKLDMLVTPFHRVLLQTFSRRPFKWNGYEFRMPAIRKYNKGRPPKICGLPVRFRIPAAAYFNGKELNLSDDLIRLVAWIVTEGSLRKIGNFKSIRITQAKNEKIDEIRSLLDNLKLEYSIWTVKHNPRRNIRYSKGKRIVENTANWKPTVTFNIHAKSSKQILKILGDNIHALPSSFLNMSQRQLRILFETLMKGDGWSKVYHTKNGTKRLPHGFSAGKNKLLADQFQEICLKLGKRAYVRCNDGVYTVQIANKSFYDVYYGVTIENYDGIVWCVNVDNGTFVARRNGAPFITGNSKAIQFLEDYGAIKIKEKTYGPFHRGDITAELPYWKAKELVDAGIARWAYPWQEYRWKVLYRFDVFTKFYEEAKRMSRAGKICEATLYLVEHAPGITVNAIAQILGRGYWTVYRCIAKYLPPEQVKRIAVKEVREQAEIEQWLPDEIVTAIRELEAEAEKPKAPKVVYGPKTPLGYSLYPVEYPTYEDLVKELRRILTLEGYMPTEDEWEEMKRQLEEQRRKWMKQKITYWLAREEEE